MLRRADQRGRGGRGRVFVIANHQIKFPELRVMDERGEALGIMRTSEALARAEASEKDLVLVTDKANPPIAKIIELSKYRYQLSQKKADERRKNRTQEIKEIRLTPFIGENDLQSKLRRARGFLSKNDKVRFSMELRGRNITKQDIAGEILVQAVDSLSDIASVEIPVKLLGKKMQLQLMPSKKSAKSNKVAEEK